MKILTIFISSSLLLLFSLSGCKEKENPSGQRTENIPPMEVHVAQVKKDTLKDQIEIMGTVQAARKAIIASRINGHIVEIPIVVGSRVETGDTLVRISAGEISAKLLQANAQLNQAERNLIRERKLLQQNAATPEAVKTQEDLFTIAQASYKEAQSMLSYAHITAPFRGIITEKFINVGDLATSGKPLIHIEGEKDLQILTDIPEALVLKMQLGDKLQVSVPAAKLSPLGTISEIAPTNDPQSRTTSVKIDLPYHPHFRSGQFARVFLTESLQHTLTIPSSALSHLGQIARVFILEEGKARLRLVRVGKEHNGRSEILAGLHAGDTIILPGDRKLYEGQDILIREHSTTL
jgi:RND family efflux transporter MFP subunit